MTVWGLNDVNDRMGSLEASLLDERYEKILHEKQLRMKFSELVKSNCRIAVELTKRNS